MVADNRTPITISKRDILKGKWLEESESKIISVKQNNKFLDDLHKLIEDKYHLSAQEAVFLLEFEKMRMVTYDLRYDKDLYDNLLKEVKRLQKYELKKKYKGNLGVKNDTI